MIRLRPLFEKPSFHLWRRRLRHGDLFDSLEDTEAYLEKNLRKDAECMYQLRGTKGIGEGNCSYDDRSFISFIVK